MSVTFQALARHYYREMKEISFRNDILPLKDKLYRLALRITFDTAEAEDIVQETLIRVWDKRNEWPQLNSIEAYCLTICRHLSLDRSEKKEAQHVALDESLHSRPDTSTPYDSLTAREGLGLLQKLLKELPQTQQDIVQLREIEGKSYKEIAAILNLSEEQVKVYLFRARQRIKQKYTEIQQLLERYWQCETSLEEEAILKTFFNQTHIPSHLMPYKPLFVSEKMWQDVKLGEDFDARIMAHIEKDEPVKARRITWVRRMMPLYKAAASVAIILTLGNAAQSSFRREATVENDYNYENYQDSYNDPEMAYNQISDALQMVSQSLSEASKQDSLLQMQPKETQKEQ